MKKFLAILILILTFQTPSQADDIQDFQIERMSIGDSLLDYFSEEEIKKETFSSNNGKSYYRVKKFNVVDFYKLDSFKTYDNVQINVKTNDSKYIIYYIAGDIDYPKNIKNCFKKKIEIVENVSDFFRSI